MMKNKITVFERTGLMLWCAIACVSALAVVGLAGCDNINGGDGGDTNPGPGTDPVPVTYREMVNLAGGVIPGSSDASINGTSYTHGVFVYNRRVTLSPFKIAKYETTYELWQEVREWALLHGYTAINAGKEGYPYADGPYRGSGTDSDEWTAEEKKRRPVTNISWRDAIVWCNAYSEMSGKEPVYYTDGSYTTPVRESSSFNGNFATDHAVRKPNANGYRLPTEAEWEYAARGGNTAVPAWNYAYAGTNTAGELGDYAWYYTNSAMRAGVLHKDYGAHPVGTKAANGAGLYDMTGNVKELCWDWYAGTVDADTVTDPVQSGTPDPAYRPVVRGGWWNVNEANNKVLSRSSATRYNWDGNGILGFRVVCAP